MNILAHSIYIDKKSCKTRYVKGTNISDRLTKIQTAGEDKL